MADMTVANTILAQLGGGRFKLMTGAKRFLGGERYLKFSLPRARDGINVVKITLTDADTYDMEFLRIRGLKVTTVCAVDGIYFDRLTAEFTDATGLATSL